MIPVNRQIARRLEEASNLLESQHANRFRVEAYRKAARTVRGLEQPVSAILEAEGEAGLDRLPGVGSHLARVIRTLVLTGRFPLLEHMRGEVDPVALLETVPGIGPVQARRLHDELAIDTLEDLEAAAHDGRLANIAGMGRKRIGGIVDSLASRLGRVRGPQELPDQPVPVAELLDVDREYREAARDGRLPTIAPRRFNPEHRAWLPVLHTARGERHYTALFSNTARAHRLGRTGDWVILYLDGSGEGLHQQYTVVTAPQGPLRGRRVVRGREAECERMLDGEDPAAGDAVDSGDGAMTR